jgi:phosphate transport system substrate-binding protein
VTIRNLAAMVIVAALAVSFSGCKKKESQSITIKGSDTMVNLVSAWAEEYMAANPKVSVSVDGGGSGTGIAALISGNTQIASASRSIKPGEIDQAKANSITPVEHAVARDAISVIVNPANTVKALTVKQIAEIYTGKITNWKDVGGPDEPITLLSRENSSGTYAFFQEHVLLNKDYSKSALFLTSNATIVQEVSANKWAIGYCGLGYLLEAKGKVRALEVKKDTSSPGIMPSEETVKSGTYSIARPLYLYTAGAPEGLVKSFLDFVMSEKGQKIVRETGFVTAK